MWRSSNWMMMMIIIITISRYQATNTEATAGWKDFKVRKSAMVP
jgi:hypothetical protein